MELTDEDLREMYRLMVLCRRFEERAVQWWREGRVAEGLLPGVGQEAVGVGSCYGLRGGDYVLPSLRTRAAFFVRGVPLREQVAAMCGKGTAAYRGKTTSHHAGYPEFGVLVGTSLVGSSIAVAAGAALAMKLQKRDNVVIDFFGDGAANRGDFHEAINLAAIFKLPIVFVCENNLYNMSVPTSSTMAIVHIADRASGYGIPGMVVDGQDVIAVHEAVQEATKRARAGSGPTLIECKTYRYFPHHPSMKEDRPLAEIERWRARDPIRILERRLLGEGTITEEEIERMKREIDNDVEEALRYAEESPYPDPETALQHVYVQPWGGG